MARENLVGQTFGRLTAIKMVENYSFRVRCSCPAKTIKNVKASCLKSGVTQSCGCLQKEAAITTGKANKKHGACKTTTMDGNFQLDYVLWRGIINRCYNKNQKIYQYYGALGIKLFKEWRKDFISFSTYIRILDNCPPEELLVSRIGGKRLKVSLDRIDNTGHYEPGNLKWSTQKEQTNNQSSNIMVEYKGKTMTLSQAVEEHSEVPYKIVLQRITRDKWTLQDALNTPSRRQRK